MCVKGNLESKGIKNLSILIFNNYIWIISNSNSNKKVKTLMKNDFNSLYERFDELYTTYDDRKALKVYIESMSRKSSKEEVEVSADNLPDTILTFEEFKTILPAINKKIKKLVVDISYILGTFNQNGMLDMAKARLKDEWEDDTFIDEFLKSHEIPF